jgi:hypothetical protein
MLQILSERLNVQTAASNHPVSVLSNIWKLCNGPYDRSVLETDADYFRTDFLEGVALEQSEIHILEATTPPPLISHSSGSVNLGTFHDTHSITFLPSVSSLAGRDGSVMFAVVRLHLKSKSDPPMPILLLYYYAPDYEKWLPLELGIPYSTRRRHGFLM